MKVLKILCLLICLISTIYAQCGNNRREPGEQCDNGNNAGCSAGCVFDAGYECYGGDTLQGDTCFELCGDGLNMGQWACDDGNLVNGDGCDEWCVEEEHVACTGGTATTPDTCVATCGDGRKVPIEACDDGNIQDGDGCNSVCTVEDAFKCDQGTGGRDDICVEVCGDGKKLGSEAWRCDDKNVYIGDGCDHNCIVEDGMVCTGGNATWYDTCTEDCGDGRNIGILPCDDGNPRDGDGCSSTCQIETGFYCVASTRTIDICYETCGDGLNFGYFDCDDGNFDLGDGCDANCETELGWRCSYGNSTTHDLCWQIIPYITEYTLFPDNDIINVKINDTLLILNTFSIHDWDIYVVGPRDTYPLNWHIQDFDELRQNEHVRDMNITLEWDGSVQFFGDGYEHIQFNITNPNNTISEMFTWPLRDQNLSMNTYGMEATWACGNSETYKFTAVTLMAIMIIFNCFAFLTFKVSMGYTWSLFFMLQYICFIPLTYVYIPSCLVTFSRWVGVHGYIYTIRDNFMYNHTLLEPLERFNYRWERAGYVYSAFLDNTADIFMRWMYCLVFLGVVVIFSEICRGWKYYEHIVRLYKWHMFYKGFMVLYLKVITMSMLNIIRIDISNTMCQLSTLMSLVFFAIFIAYPVVHTLFALKYKKMPLEKKKESFVFSEVLFDEFAVYKSIQYFYFWQFCLKRLIFAIVLLSVTNPVIQLSILMAIFVLNLAWLFMVRPYKHYIRMFHSGFNDSAGLVLTGLYFQFTNPRMGDYEYYRYAQMIMRVIIGVILVNILMVFAHWIFELFFRLFPFCCVALKKKLEKAEVDDEEVVSEEEALPSEESVEKQVIVQPPVEIEIPAAGVLVEKGQEYQMEKDTIKQNEDKNKKPIEEVKEIRPTNVGVDDDDVIINKPKGR